MFNIQVRVLLLLVSGSLMVSCSVQKAIGTQARALVLNDTALATAHVGNFYF
jgi:hypothetical protein